VNISLRHLLVPLALVCASSAQAQLIDDVDFRREGANAVLQVRFVAPIQYRRALIAKSGDAVQVIFDVVNARDNATLVPSERRLAGGGAMPDISVTDESPGRENVNRKLSVRLSKPAPFRVRAGRGDRTIEVVLLGLGTAIPASVKAPAAPTRTSGFQISLQQSDSQNIQLDTPIPSALQRYQVFTGERMLNGKRVFEINLGYFDTLVEAEAARQLLAKRFPEASIVALTPPPPPQHQFCMPASGISTKLGATMLSRLRGWSMTPPRRTIWHGSWKVMRVSSMPAVRNLPSLRNWSSSSMMCTTSNG